MRSSHLILLVNLPDNFVHHELLLEELLVGLLPLELLLHELLLQLPLMLQRLLLALLLQLLQLHGGSRLLALRPASEVCLLALMSEEVMHSL